MKLVQLIAEPATAIGIAALYMESHCLASCGGDVLGFEAGFVTGFEGAGSMRLGTVKYDIAKLAPTKAEDSVMPTKVPAMELGWDAAIAGSCCCLDS